VARTHFEAGYVPAHHSVAAFAQALRAVGEAVFGRPASQVPMSRVLLQLFEITALYEMRLRPELVLLQKTMMTVEGVARRIMPDHDIWAAADPVVRRWMARELSPAARLRRFAEEAHQALRNIARMLEHPPGALPVAATVEEEPAAMSRLLWFAIGAVLSGGAFLVAALWFH
jgi:ubiquinone biosynthesis protein